MFTILHILQVIALYLLYGDIASYIWWIILMVFIAIYFAGKTYTHGITDTDESRVVSLWHRIRSLVFIIDIVSVLILYGYILLS